MGLFGGLTPTGERNPDRAIDDVMYLQQAYAHQGGIMKNYFDVLAAHPGSNSNSPDQLWPDNPGTGKCPPKFADREGTCWKNHPSFYFRRIEQQYDVMVANGDGNKQMWLTEFGGAPTTRPTATSTASSSALSCSRIPGEGFEKGIGDYPDGRLCACDLNFSTLGLPPEREGAVVGAQLRLEPPPAFIELRGCRRT